MKNTRYLLAGVCYLLAAILILQSWLSNSSIITFSVFAINIALGITNIKKFFLGENDDNEEQGRQRDGSFALPESKEDDDIPANDKIDE